MGLVASLATRGRPQQLLATLQRHMACMTRPDTKMIVQCDQDDFATIACLGGAQLDPRVSINIKPREDTVAAKWNRGLSEPGDVYLCAADDDPYLTPSIDEKILQAAANFPDGIGLIYGRLANLSFPCVIAYTAKWPEVFDGKLQPEYFPYWFADHWTDDVGRMIGRIKWLDITTDQSKAGKTMEMREPGWWATWFDAAYRFRRSQALKIIDSPQFQSPDWLKEHLRTSYLEVEVRSKNINESVRAQQRQFAMWSGLNTQDERYKRIRAAAVEMLPHLLNDYGMEPDERRAYQEALDPPKTIAALPRAYG